MLSFLKSFSHKSDICVVTLRYLPPPGGVAWLPSILRLGRDSRHVTIQGPFTISHKLTQTFTNTFPFLTDLKPARYDFPPFILSHQCFQQEQQGQGQGPPVCPHFKILQQCFPKSHDIKLEIPWIKFSPVVPFVHLVKVPAEASSSPPLNGNCRRSRTIWETPQCFLPLAPSPRFLAPDFKVAPAEGSYGGRRPHNGNQPPRISHPTTI